MQLRILNVEKKIQSTSLVMQRGREIHETRHHVEVSFMLFPPHGLVAGISMPFL